MKVAVIDMGSNSTRLYIAESDTYAAARPVLRETTITGLGKDAGPDGQLRTEAIDRTTTVLEEYARVIAENDVSMTRVAATAAMREAPNADAVLDKVEAILGVRPKIILGEMEATLTFIGVLSDPLIANMGLEYYIYDIGGGSTEIMQGFDRPRILKSLPLGCVKLRDRLLLSDPPTEVEIQGARDHVRGVLESEFSPQARPHTVALAVAGTATTLASIELGLEPYDPDQIHRFRLPVEAVEDRLASLAALPLSERKKVVGLEPKRADTIVSGAIILSTIMQFFGHREVLISERDILDGLAMTAIADYNKKANTT